MTRVAYISGPIAGHEGFNEPLFRAAERRLSDTRPNSPKKWRYDLVLVPHDIPPHLHEGPCPPSYAKNGEHTAACYLRTDLSTMLLYATDVWMLPGWEASVGARLEMQVAAACGLGIKFFHRQDLGCAHNDYGWGKCEESSCWNYRKPLDQVHSAEEIQTALRRAGEAASFVTPQSVKIAPATARKLASMACVHPLIQFGNEAFCKVETCPNYYARNAL